jgi:DNA-binding NtrC family response regulator
MVADGRFRSDLFHRLGQINITAPPIRERPDDILPIAQYFLAQQNPSLCFSSGAAELLRVHTWPGNIRVLRNVITTAAVLARGPEIQAADLPLTLNPRPKTVTAVPIDQAPAANLDRLERNTILETLAKTNGHQQRAADLLGISRRTLSRKLKLYGTEAARHSCAS